MQKVEKYFENDNNIMIRIADCRKNPKLCSELYIKEHPTFRLWKENAELKEYKGPRNNAVVIEWIKAMSKKFQKVTN